MLAIHLPTIRLRRLLSGALFAATLALGFPAVVAAAPFDPFSNEDCVDAGGHPLDCCINNNGEWIPGHGPGGNSSEMGVCVPPGGTTSTGPGGSGGAGPAGAQTAPPEVVPRQGVTPPQDAATRPPPPPPIITFTPMPANPG